MAAEAPAVAALEVPPPAETSAESHTAEEAQPSDASVPAEKAEKVICRRCNEETDPANALCQEKFRIDLRWTCKSCHAVLTQVNRHGVELRSLLTETDSTAWFQSCKIARMNASDQRLSYVQARGLLKQQMIESASKVPKEGECGEFQPLGYWMLKGYNVENIERDAEHRTHPLLGDVYKVAIESESTENIKTRSEQRILQMEAEARERAQARSQPAAPLSAPLDLPLQLEDQQSGRKRKTPEEKKIAQEQAKAQRQEDKKRQKVEIAACAAAAKLLPQLKKCHEKMAGCNEKIAELSAHVALPDGSKEQLQTAQTGLDTALANCSKILGATAKGGSLSAFQIEDLSNDKELNSLIKDVNAAIRTAQEFIRANKENLPKKNAKAKK